MDHARVDTSDPLKWGTSRVRMPIRLVNINKAGNDVKAEIDSDLKTCLTSCEPILDERTIEPGLLLKLTHDIYEAMRRGCTALRVYNEDKEIVDLALISLMTARAFGSEAETTDSIATRPIGHYKRRKDEFVKALTDAQRRYWAENGEYIWFDTAVCGHNMAVMEYLARGGHSVLFLCPESQLPAFEKIGAERVTGIRSGRNGKVVMSLRGKWRMGSRL